MVIDSDHCSKATLTDLDLRVAQCALCGSPKSDLQQWRRPDGGRNRIGRSLLYI